MTNGRVSPKRYRQVCALKTNPNKENMLKYLKSLIKDIISTENWILSEIGELNESLKANN